MIKQQKITKPILVDERLELLFRHLGLSEKQAKLYRLLLLTGGERASVLSRRSGIKRGNTYALLYDLKSHNLVSEFERDNVVYFKPEAPVKLAEIVKDRQQDAQLAHDLASDMLPKLNSQYKTAIGKPVVQYFEGKEGIKEVFEDIYAPKKEPVYGCVDLEKSDETFPAYIMSKLIPKRIKNKLFAYSFVGDSVQARTIQKKDAEQLRKTILVDKNKFPLPAEIDVYEDRIAMLTFEQGEFIGMIIENKALATTLKSIFKLAFEKQAIDEELIHPEQLIA